MVILDAKDVTFTYEGDVRGVRGVSVQVSAGELVCLLGPNGAGKTTLARLLCGLLDPDSGGVAWRGQPLQGMPPRERARCVALVPQSMDRIPPVGVREFIMMGRYAHQGRFGSRDEVGGERVQDCLRRTSLDGMEDRPLRALSGGQLQRALIARALAQDAPALVVDEPTNSLDPAHQLQVFRMLVDVARGDDRCGVIATHDLNLAAQFATRLLLMKDGAVVADGAPPEVLVPDVLEPVYGAHFRYGSWERPGSADGDQRFVVPWCS